VSCGSRRSMVGPPKRENESEESATPLRTTNSGRSSLYKNAPLVLYNGVR